MTEDCKSEMMVQILTWTWWRLKPNEEDVAQHPQQMSIRTAWQTYFLNIIIPLMFIKYYDHEKLAVLIIYNV